MGVPGFFGWLLKYYRKYLVMKKKPDGNHKILFLDANCGIHPKCFEILNQKTEEIERKKLEKEMVEHVIKYFELMIELIKPELTYIAVDGVAPVAKIKQQRIRRFKSVYEKNFIDQLKIKYKKPLTPHWDNVSISPGTQFMGQITEAINQFIKKNEQLKIIFSSADEVGEGEQKILRYIKNLKENHTLIVYGLDADLIFLMMVSGKKNIYLMRECDQLDTKERHDEFFFVPIDILKECLSSHLTENLKSIPIDTDRLINDFILLAYFMGNDFLPHFVSINIKQNGMDILIKNYVKCVLHHQNYFLTKNKNINLKFLLTFLKFLIKKERIYLEKDLPIYEAQRLNRKLFFHDEYEYNLQTIRNLTFEIKDDMQLGIGKPEEWKKRYYYYCFQQDDSSKSIQEVCYYYLQSLMWVKDYYFKDCSSWTWYYPYEYAPLMEDLYSYCCQLENLKEIKYPKGEPISQIVQLIAIIPPQCAYLLPKKYQSLLSDTTSPIIDLFPINFTEDMLYKDAWHKCIPILPLLNIERIKDAVDKIE